MFTRIQACFMLCKQLILSELCQCERQIVYFHNLVVFPQMTTSAFNPFTWDNSSAVVNSHVLSLNLKDHKGKPLTVKDSNEDIEIKIPRRVRFNSEETVSFFVKPSSQGKMQYHEVHLPRAEGNAVRLRVSIVI